MVEWLRGDGSNPQATASRLRLLLDAAQVRPELGDELKQWWRVLAETVDSTMVLADYGFSPRMAFFSEAVYRLGRKILPGTPETTDAAELFSLVFPYASDVAWISALDAQTLTRLGDLIGTPSPRFPVTLWQDELLQAITYCASQIRATGFASELRLRMSAPAREAQPFIDLAADVEAFRQAFLSSPRDSDLVNRAAQTLRERLELCRSAAASVYPHLDEHGISVNLVFVLRQLRERVLRVRDLMDCLLSDNVPQSAARLTAKLVQAGVERRSLLALVNANASLLAAKMAERSAETGEHYITRDRAEYSSMLAKAAGGGAATSLTTLFKFIITGLGLTAFWSGVASGLMYAMSFVLIQLLHWTLATKQPAMTAPAMAAKLKDLNAGRAIEDFVDEVSHLVRSQVAAVVGNVGLVVPCVLLISLVMQLSTGAPMISLEEADYVFKTLHLLHPSTLLFAAYRGAAVQLKPDRRLGRKLVCTAPAGFGHALQPTHHAADGGRSRCTLGAIHADANFWIRVEHFTGLDAGTAPPRPGLCGRRPGSPPRHPLCRATGGGRSSVWRASLGFTCLLVVRGRHPLDWHA